ncbi:MAG TPA: hypothetical protein VGM09_25190 [Bradyrhizobium sp.]
MNGTTQPDLDHNHRHYERPHRHPDPHRETTNQSPATAMVASGAPGRNGILPGFAAAPSILEAGRSSGIVADILQMLGLGGVDASTVKT